MVITYHGVEFFKIALGNTTVAVNPISKKSKHKSASFGADMVLTSVNHPDMNGVEIASRGDKEPFVISGAGEYEVSDVFVRGFDTKTTYDDMTRNTAYLIKMENMQLCFLGALSEGTLPHDLDEALEEIDVLFVPIGGDGVLSSKEAHKLAVYLEPKIVIPMHYESKQLTAFLKEEGVQNGKPKDKLTLKQSDLSGKAGEVVVLKVV